MFIGHLAEVPGSNPSAGSYRYYATDLIRSTRHLFNQSKTQVAQYEYTPYGELYGSSGSVSTTRRDTGHQWDATSKLYFAPYRYYRPDIARWLSPDPAGFVDGLNVYGYATGTPIMLYDILGLACGPGGRGDKAIPDSCLGLDSLGKFTDACQMHDDCYEGCGNFAVYSKLQCDVLFAQALRDVCSRLSFFRKIICQQCADIYTGAVTLGGWPFYTYKDRGGKCCETEYFW